MINRYLRCRSCKQRVSLSFQMRYRCCNHTRSQPDKGLCGTTIAFAGVSEQNRSLPSVRRMIVDSVSSSLVIVWKASQGHVALDAYKIGSQMLD